MWYDKYKAESIVINTDDEHSKFWISQIDEQTKTVLIRWGRIGTKGQQQSKDFSSIHEAASFVDSKRREKTRKGYRLISKEKFDEACIQAAIVGSANKCHGLKWAEMDAGDHFAFVDDARLQAPDCNPAIYVELETKKAYGGQHDFHLLFTFEKVYVINSGETMARPTGLISKTHPLHELTVKVEEAIGRTLSGT